MADTKAPETAGDTKPRDLVLRLPLGAIPAGRVVTGVPHLKAQELIAGKKARAASRRDVRIAGGLAVPFPED